MAKKTQTQKKKKTNRNKDKEQVNNDRGSVEIKVNDTTQKVIPVGKVVNTKETTVKMKYMGKEREIILNCPFDMRKYDKETVLEWYKTINLGRRLDEKAALYLKQGKGWSYHAPFGGHDGIQFAIGKLFKENQDKSFLFPYYRDMLTSLSAGLTLEELLLNGLSKEDDVAGGGRHMSNHFAKPSLGVQNVSSCVGNHSQHAAGLARAIKKYNDDKFVIYSGGESAASEGFFWEALNCATLEQLPVIFVIQNNKYGISVPVYEQTANSLVSHNYIGFKNLKIFECNGRCPFNSFNALEQAKEYVMSGKGPAMVHADCDRIGSHSNSDPHKLYRDDEELEEANKRDPMLQFRYSILNEGLITQEELEELEKENQNEIFRAADNVEPMPNADGTKYNEFLVPEAYAKIEDDTERNLNPEAEQITYLQGINESIKEEFRRNPNTYAWGQDVASKDKGGVFNAFKGMLQEFGKDRIFNSPIAENNIVGTADGFCRYRDDIWVCIEGAEFADYFWPAMDQLVELSHEYWRTKGQYSPNVVIRLASGGYIQGGLYHSQNLEAAFTTLPGIRVVQPAFAEDAVGLMRNAMRSRGVTMYLEPKFLYNFKQAAGPKPPEDFVVPFGKAKVRREGTDISVIAYGSGVHMSLLAAKELEKEGISMEVVDLRSLNPLDKDTIIESVKKTNKSIVVHEDKVFGGFGGEIASNITEFAFEYLDAPVKRIGSKFTPVGFAQDYEKEILLSVEDVKHAVQEIVKY